MNQTEIFRLVEPEPCPFVPYKGQLSIFAPSPELLFRLGW